MSYTLTFVERPTYLHATVTGPNSREVVTSYLNAIIDECQQRAGRQLLIEERLTGPRMKMVEIFQIVVAQCANALGRFRKIAYVDVNAEGDLMLFAETVAVNRGLPVRVFSSVAEAEQWLLGTKD